MRTVKDVANLTGISVRTLHYYDHIGLLKPTTKTEAGYRLYDDQALRQLQSILFFRELQFSLKEIKNILNSPDFNYDEALAQQIALLELKQERLTKLISDARNIQKKGSPFMTNNIFNDNELKAYKAEVKARWGETNAYKEYIKRKQKGVINETAIKKLMTFFVAFGNMRHKSPTDLAVQQTIANFQNFINNNFYTCSNDLLNSLGNMYVLDERFKECIDQTGGTSTASFVQKAIQEYCNKS